MLQALDMCTSRTRKKSLNECKRRISCGWVQSISCDILFPSRALAISKRFINLGAMTLNWHTRAGYKQYVMYARLSWPTMTARTQSPFRFDWIMTGVLGVRSVNPLVSTRCKLCVLWNDTGKYHEKMCVKEMGTLRWQAHFSPFRTTFPDAGFTFL